MSLGLAAALIAGGCATGDDGIIPRDPDGGRMDAGGGGDVDAGDVDSGAAPACDPPCTGTDVCRAGACVAAGEDRDRDGVASAIDCNDDDASVGSTDERGCSSACGAGVERCVDGDWQTCTAPLTCECVEGSAPRELDCGMCGTQRQVCAGGAWADEGGCTGEGPCAPGDIDMGGLCGNCGRQERRCQADCTWGAFTCVDEGECMAGAVDSESRGCTGGCGGNETRSRTCNSSCVWGAFGPYAGCPTCGPVCGDSTCEGGETCESCADCRYGHLGTGNNGDPCPGVPAETWRCVTRSDGLRVSQVCRGGMWVSFHLTPRDCNACRCSYSLSCCQAGASGC